MKKNRLEAFSDGVLAIIVTILVLELKIPHGGELAALKPLLPIFGCYVFSFIIIGIYWNNHHHLFMIVEQVSGKVLWANMHLLFWLSLLPFATAWMGENNFQLWPVVIYGLVLLMASVAYYILVRALLPLHHRDSEIAKAIGKDKKGRISIILYLAGLGLAFIHPLLGILIYVSVTAMWLIPDRRIEHE